MLSITAEYTDCMKPASIPGCKMQKLPHNFQVGWLIGVQRRFHTM